jgi:hypothetical protein
VERSRPGTLPIRPAGSIKVVQSFLQMAASHGPHMAPVPG